MPACHGFQGFEIWAGGKVIGIRDFAFARYAMEGAELAVMD
jgi:hypothetical protein